MDLGGSPVLKYRELYSKKSGQKLPRYVIPVFVLMMLFLGGLTLWNLRKQRGYAAGAAQNIHNLPSMKARKKSGVYNLDTAGDNADFLFTFDH